MTKGQGTLFAMGGSLLLTIATEIIMISYYWKMLEGPAVIAIVGLFFVAWVQVWSSWWYASEQNDKPVRYTALVASFLLAVVMVANAGVVLAVRNQERKETVQRLAKAKEAEKRADEVIRIRKESGSWRTVQEFQKAELEREKLEQEKAQKERKEQEIAEASVSSKGEWEKVVAEYARFWIFIVPFGFALICKLAVDITIARPGGAEPGRPTGNIRTQTVPLTSGGQGPSTLQDLRNKIQAKLAARRGGQQPRNP